MSTPKPPPAPAIPQQVLQQTSEVVDQAALDQRNRERRRQASLYGRQSTILAGNLPNQGVAPTSSTKTLLGPS